MASRNISIVFKQQEQLDEYFSKAKKTDVKYINDCCPDCDSQNIQRQGKCRTCLDCGWSSCSR